VKVIFNNFLVTERAGANGRVVVGMRHTAAIVNTTTVNKSEDGLIVGCKFARIFRRGITNYRDVGIIIRVGMSVLFTPTRAFTIIERGGNVVVKAVKHPLEIMALTKHLVIAHGGLPNLLPELMEDPLGFISPKPEVTFTRSHSSKKVGLNPLNAKVSKDVS